ncbi:MAG: hypothetical protein KUG78_03150 [Kangiellaceae bacterium]|nr:hypothetical protein [Kangiellaceae bacterium]
MIISSTPIALPISTANVPTEALTAEVAQRPRIPQPTSASENTAAKNSTEFSEQSKNYLSDVVNGDAESIVEDKESSKQDNPEKAEQQAEPQSEDKATDELELDELQQVRHLQNVDREVRAHEQAHSAVGGTLAGAPNLNFVTGPDGKRYAISGEVSIDNAVVNNDPAATIRKLEQVQRAALAPANPSSQDRQVAAQAAAGEIAARSELNALLLDETQETDKNSSESDGTKTSLNSSNDPDRINLDRPATASSTTLASPVSTDVPDSSSNINPVTARRQSALLNQRIAGSGALDLSTDNSHRSFVV